MKYEIYWNYHKGIWGSPLLFISKQMFESGVKMYLKAILTSEVWSLVTVFQEMNLLLSINIFEEQKISLGISNWGKELKILHEICLNLVPKLPLICDYCHRHAWKTAASPLLRRTMHLTVRHLCSFSWAKLNTNLNFKLRNWNLLALFIQWHKCIEW